jgi:hypothetical protein
MWTQNSIYKQTLSLEQLCTSTHLESIPNSIRRKLGHELNARPTVVCTVESVDDAMYVVQRQGVKDAVILLPGPCLTKPLNLCPKTLVGVQSTCKVKIACSFVLALVIVESPCFTCAMHCTCCLS